MNAIEKVAVIGLDCAEPSLVFDEWIDHLPNIKRLIDGGTYGDLTSTIPPITVPADGRSAGSSWQYFAAAAKHTSAEPG